MSQSVCYLTRRVYHKRRKRVAHSSDSACRADFRWLIGLTFEVAHSSTPAVSERTGTTFETRFGNAFDLQANSNFLIFEFSIFWLGLVYEDHILPVLWSAAVGTRVYARLVSECRVAGCSKHFKGDVGALCCHAFTAAVLLLYAPAQATAAVHTFRPNAYFSSQQKVCGFPRAIWQPSCVWSSAALWLFVLCLGDKEVNAHCIGVVSPFQWVCVARPLRRLWER